MQLLPAIDIRGGRCVRLLKGDFDRETRYDVDPVELAKFDALAADWWNPDGKFKPLHMLNPIRLDYITAQIAGEFDRDLGTRAPFAGLRILDIGCGKGFLMFEFTQAVPGIEVSGMGSGKSSWLREPPG